MGANYLLGGEEQEGWTLLLLRRKKNKHHTCLCLLQGENSKLSSRTHMKLTFHVKFCCFALGNSGQEVDFEHQRLQCVVHDAAQTVTSISSVSTEGKQHSHQRPLVSTASPSRVVLKQQGLWWELLCLLLPCVCFHYCTPTATILNHSIIFTFFPTDYPLPPKKTKMKYML